MSAPTTTPSIAPTFPQSPADRAAHRSSSHRRGEQFAPLSPAAIRRLEEDLAWDLHNRSKATGAAA